MDAAGIEPATSCLQSREEKTLKCFDGVAYTENQQNSRSPVVPKLYRVLAPATLLEKETSPLAKEANQYSEAEPYETKHGVDL